MQRRIVTFALVLCVATTTLAQMAEGDRHWAARAEGHQGGRASAVHVNAAIAAYQKEVAQNSNDLVARGKLLRAIRFKGEYVATSKDDKKQVYGVAKSAGEEALAVVDRQLRARGVTSVTKATEKQIADAARAIPGAGEVFLWDSINWGEWALVYGKLAAVRQGAADRIRREATIAMLVDPKFEGGAPARVLGRLHDQTPHVPFLTGWVSSREAIRLLNESLRLDPGNKMTRTFLAEAMVNDNSSARPKAIQLLRETIAAPNTTPEYEVEQAKAAEEARALLNQWGAK